MSMNKKIGNTMLDVTMYRGYISKTLRTFLLMKSFVRVLDTW